MPPTTKSIGKPLARLLPHLVPNRRLAPLFLISVLLASTSLNQFRIAAGGGGRSRRLPVDRDGFPGEERDTITIPPKRRRLEFLHIPKTGGSSIEAAAGERGIPWGGCHFAGDRWSICPPLNATAALPSLNDTIWHYPLQFLPSFGLPSDPYSNLAASPDNGGNWGDEVRFFAVVRNPYDRILSKYFYLCDNYYLNRDKNSPVLLNRYLKETLTDLMSGELGYFHDRGHYIPQHDYVFDSDGNRMVNHVLRYEHLAEDFDELMAEYSLNVTLPPRRARNSRAGVATGIEDIDAENRYRIETLYEKDFALGGYPKLSDGRQ